MRGKHLLWATLLDAFWAVYPDFAIRRRLIRKCAQNTKFSSCAAQVPRRFVFALKVWLSACIIGGSSGGEHAEYQANDADWISFAPGL